MRDSLGRLQYAHDQLDDGKTLHTVLRDPRTSDLVVYYVEDNGTEWQAVFGEAEVAKCKTLADLQDLVVYRTLSDYANALGI